MWWHYSLKILILEPWGVKDTKGLMIPRNGLISQECIFFWVARRHWKTNVHVLRSLCIRSPYGQQCMCSWPDCTPLGQRDQGFPTVMLMVCISKKRPICVSKTHQFVGHMAAEISSNLKFSLDCHHFPKWSPILPTSAFLPFASFQPTLFAGKLPWYLLHI